MSRRTQSANRRSVRGFTLLEVMIAMAILAMSLTALLGHEGIAIQMSGFSNRLSQATLLSRGKMYDIEHKLLKDSIDLYDNCEEGDFRDEGFRRFKWKVCAYKLELNESAAEALTERFTAMLGGGAGGASPGSGGGAGGALQGASMQMQLQMMLGMLPTFLQNLEDKIRKVRLEVTWKDAIRPRSMVIERFVTSLGTDPKDGPPPKDGQAQIDWNEER